MKINWIRTFNRYDRETITDHYDDSEFGIMASLDEDLPRHADGEIVDSVMYMIYQELVILIETGQWLYLADKYRELIAYTPQALTDHADSIRCGQEIDETHLTDFNWGRI